MITGCCCYWHVNFKCIAPVCHTAVLAYLIAAIAPSIDVANAALPVYVSDTRYHAPFFVASCSPSQPCRLGEGGIRTSIHWSAPGTADCQLS